MKTLIRISWLPLMVALLFTACKPEIKEIGPYNEVIDGFPGNWELNKVTITDLLQPVPETKDASAIYMKSNTKWVLAFDGDGTYNILEKGPGPDVFGDAGTWELTPRADFPTNIVLTPSGMAPVSFKLANMPLVTDQDLGLSYTRNSCGQDYITYNFTFNRQ